MSDLTTEQTATDRLRAMLDERGVDWTQGMAWNVTVINGDWLIVEDVDFGTLSVSTTAYQLTPEQAVAATLGDETPKKCSTCQYRYCVGQRPYPSFGYRCGFGDGKKLCGGNTSVLDHMCCEHWEKELR